MPGNGAVQPDASVAPNLLVILRAGFKREKLSRDRRMAVRSDQKR